MNKLVSVFSKTVGFITVCIVLTAFVFIMPRTVGIVPYIVLSGSMAPSVKAGAVAFIDTNDKEAEVGDIITYSLPSVNGSESRVTHRVVGIDSGSFITKGDANDVQDLNLVSQSQVIGIYRWQIPKAGYMLAELTPRVINVIILWVILLNLASVILPAVLVPDQDSANGE